MREAKKRKRNNRSLQLTFCAREAVVEQCWICTGNLPAHFSVPVPIPATCKLLSYGSGGYRSTPISCPVIAPSSTGADDDDNITSLLLSGLGRVPPCEYLLTAMLSWAHVREGQEAAVAPPALGDRKGMHPVSSCSRAWVSSHRWWGRGPIAVETDVICVSNGGGGLVSPSVSSTLTIELAQESVTGKFVQHRDVIGARWTLDSGVLSWCMEI